MELFVKIVNVASEKASTEGDILPWGRRVRKFMLVFFKSVNFHKLAATFEKTLFRTK